MLTLARDRVGEKPLAYYWDGAILASASELKALRLFHEAHLDPASLDAYFGPWLRPRAPLAIFRHTRKLAAGHLIELHEGHFAGAPVVVFPNGSSPWPRPGKTAINNSGKR